jgi:hypothetical protein
MALGLLRRCQPPKARLRFTHHATLLASLAPRAWFVN